MMHTAAAPVPRLFTEIDPHSEWVREEESDVLMVDLSGFEKELLRVVINTSGGLKISGERPIDGNRWVRFLKELSVPKDCDARGIKARFDKKSGLLYVILPKIATQNDPQGQTAHAKQNGSSSRGGSAGERATAPGVRDEATREKAEKWHEQGGGHAEGAKVGSEMKEGISESYGDFGHGFSMRKPRLGDGGLAIRLSKHKLFIVNVVVALMVIVGLGAYAMYKFRIAPEKNRS